MTRPQPWLSEEERQAPRALVEHALRLVGRIHRADPEQARAAEAELQRWRQTSPGHADAVATAQRIWNVSAVEGLRDQVPLPPSAAQARRARRRVIGLFGAVGLLAVLGGGGHRYWQRRPYQTALQTGRGQLQAHTLPDGSSLQLAANTVLEVALDGARRHVRLRSGEARFEVARDASRPFVVDTAWGGVRVLGTVFTVSARDERMRVAVAQGRVAVWPAAQRGAGAGASGSAPEQEPPAGATTLQAGESIEFDARGRAERAAVDRDEVADWTQGWLVFRNTRLSEAVARWNDYLDPPLRLADDAALRQLRVTGSYPLKQPDAFVDSLPGMLPVRVVRRADGGVEIGARR